MAGSCNILSSLPYGISPPFWGRGPEGEETEIKEALTARISEAKKFSEGTFYRSFGYKQ